MQVETDEPELIERVTALDVGKAEVVCGVRIPGPRGQRVQEVRTVSTMTAALLALGSGHSLPHREGHQGDRYCA
jgi:hypothetical protein